MQGPDLFAELRAGFEGTHVGTLEPDALRAALAASVLALMRDSAEARLPHADTSRSASRGFADEAGSRLEREGDL